MFMEAGAFGGELLPDWTLSKVFSARVVIPDSEFALLGLGDYEQPSKLPACFRWCFDLLGRGGTHWAPELTDPTAAVVYFKRIQDAIAFVARWNTPKSTSCCSVGETSAQRIRVATSLFSEAHAGIFDNALNSQPLDWHALLGLPVLDQSHPDLGTAANSPQALHSQ
jgi:hypothetical protein